jgi:hypothetical protein
MAELALQTMIISHTHVPVCHHIVANNVRHLIHVFIISVKMRLCAVCKKTVAMVTNANVKMASMVDIASLQIFVLANHAKIMAYVSTKKNHSNVVVKTIFPVISAKSLSIIATLIIAQTMAYV